MAQVFTPGPRLPPSGAPLSEDDTLGVEAVVDTAGATGPDAVISEIIDLAAIFPAGTYGAWSGYACDVTLTNPKPNQFVGLTVQKNALNGEWELAANANGPAIAAGSSLLVRMLPPGTDLTP